jgi:hypothetical protein
MSSMRSILLSTLLHGITIPTICVITDLIFPYTSEEQTGQEKTTPQLILEVGGQLFFTAWTIDVLYNQILPKIGVPSEEGSALVGNFMFMQAQPHLERKLDTLINRFGESVSYLLFRDRTCFHC